MTTGRVSMDDAGQSVDTPRTLRYILARFQWHNFLFYIALDTKQHPKESVWALSSTRP